MDYNNTRYIEIENQKHCIYCLKKMITKEWIEDGYYEYVAHFCDCEDAKKEIELENNLDKAQKELHNHIDNSFQNMAAYPDREKKREFTLKKCEILIDIYSKRIEECKNEIKLQEGDTPHDK